MIRRRNFSWAVALLVVIALAASPSGAVVIKINSCPTITTPGSYVLARNVNGTAAAGDCIIIDADFVTLDLNGFTVGGAGVLAGGVPAGDGIAGGPSLPKEVVVRNGVVTGFIDGIDFLTNSSAGAHIRGIRAIDNTENGISVGASSTVIDCAARDNGFSGIRSGAFGLIRQNLVSFNSVFGIFASVKSIVTGNTARDNSSSGITAGEGSTVTGNVAADNAGFGLALDCPSFVHGNTAHDNSLTDINIGMGTGCESSENVPAVVLP